MLLAGCGAGNGNGSSNASSATEPPAGIDSSYTGDLPMPKVTERYDNHQSRDNVKDGGTLTLSIVEIGPNWNYLSSDGNTGYMSELWSWYQPSLLMTDQVNGSPIKVNPDFLTDMKLVSKDPMVVQYDINPKAKWNDGSDIDWTAFKATWEANNGSNPDYNPPSTDGFDRIASVEQGDSPKQVKVTYKTPYYPWQEVFGALVNPKAADPKTFTQGWVKNPHNEWAAGPYKVDSFSDSQVTFVPNEKWWGNKPKLDKIVYKQMADTASLNAFQNGEIDAVEASTKDDIKAIRSVKDAQLRIGYSTKTRVLEYNGKSKPLDDLQVRKAITQAFDVNTYNSVQFQGLNWKAEQPGSELLLPMAWQAPSAMTFVVSAPQLYTSDGPSNFSYVGSKKIDELVKKAGSLSDYDEQTKAVNAAEKEAFKLYGTIPVSNPASYLGAKKGLANYGPSGFAGNLPQDIGWQK